MKYVREFVGHTLFGGLLILLPIYLTILLAAKAIEVIKVFVGPIAAFLPAEIRHEGAVSLIILLLICFLVGLMVRTRAGQAVVEWLERAFFDRIPGYELVRGLTQQMFGKSDGSMWRPALAEIEEALCPAFVIETHEDGRHTVFIPSSPTPLAGAVYVLTPERVHFVDASFARVTRSMVRWGFGTKDLASGIPSPNS